VEQLVRRASDLLGQTFGNGPQVVSAAPGRVNLIGEHTDYNEGYVLPCAIDRWTVAAVRPSTDRVWRVVSDAYPGEVVEIPLEASCDPQGPQWSRYIQGVLVWWLRQRGELPGAAVALTSNVPVGGGLSSSAALEVAIATALEGLTGQRLDPVQKALACQWAEHQYAGVPCGLMDQLTAVVGEADCAVLIDCRTNRFRPVPFDTQRYAIVVMDSGVRHELAQGEYAARRQDCQEAAAILSRSHPHVWTLRDVTITMLEEHRDQLGERLLRRARHVVTENHRTATAAAALVSGDYELLGQLMVESQSSLAGDYEVSCEELDLLVDSALGGGALGARLTGGGFGGSAIALVPAAQVGDLIATVQRDAKQQLGREIRVERVRPSGGATLIAAPHL